MKQVNAVVVGAGATNGGFNPVLTIMALAYWVSDYIKKEWKGTRLRK